MTFPFAFYFLWILLHLLPRVCLALVPSISFPSNALWKMIKVWNFFYPRDWHFCRHKWDWFSGTSVWTPRIPLMIMPDNIEVGIRHFVSSSVIYQLWHFGGVILMLLCLSVLFCKQNHHHHHHPISSLKKKNKQTIIHVPLTYVYIHTYFFFTQVPLHHMLCKVWNTQTRKLNNEITK